MDEITFREIRDLPFNQLYTLFKAVGWAEADIPEEHLRRFNIGFINSTVVFSAWDADRLVGCVRALSDRIFRSVIYDLAVLPDYQSQGIGTALLKRIIGCFPNTEWLVETTPSRASYYEKFGFKRYGDVVMTIPCRLF